MKLAGVLKRRSEGPVYRFNDPAAFVGVSEGVAQEMREHYPEFAARVLTIHNGIDVRAFAPGAHVEQARAERARLALAPEELTVAFVGSEWGRKGLEPVIRALPDRADWTLLVVGDGDREHYGGSRSSSASARACASWACARTWR